MTHEASTLLEEGPVLSCLLTRVGGHEEPFRPSEELGSGLVGADAVPGAPRLLATHSLRLARDVRRARRPGDERGRKGVYTASKQSTRYDQSCIATARLRDSSPLPHARERSAMRGASPRQGESAARAAQRASRERGLARDGAGSKQNGAHQLATRLGANQDTSLPFEGDNVPDFIELLSGGTVTARYRLIKNQVGTVLQH